MKENKTPNIDPKKGERLRKKPVLEPSNTELAEPEEKPRNPKVEDPAGEAAPKKEEDPK